MSQRHNVIGVSISSDLLERIDRDRGDVPRSRFLQRLVEHAYIHKENASAEQKYTQQKQKVTDKDRDGGENHN